MEIGIQIIGFIGLLFVITSFQKNERSFVLLFQLFAALFFATHYALLNAWTGAAMNGLSATRAFAFHKRDSTPWLQKEMVMYIFILLFWIAGFITWQSYYSILPVIAMTLECFALWSSNTRVIRWLFISARPMWIVYNVIVGSYAGLVTEAFIVGSLLIAIYRFDILKKVLVVKS